MLAILSFSWTAFGQRSNRGPGLEVREDPSLDRSRGGRGGPRGARGSRLDIESTNRAVEEIEKQLAAIKKAMEGIETPGGREGRGRGPNSGGDFRAMMEQMRQRTDAVQTAAAVIAEQVLVLKGRQAGVEFEEGIAEFQSIADSATAEKAMKTAKLVQGIIDTRNKTFQETVERLRIPVRGRRGDRGGPDGRPGR